MKTIKIILTIIYIIIQVSFLATAFFSLYVCYMKLYNFGYEHYVNEVIFVAPVCALGMFVLDAIKYQFVEIVEETING